MAIQLVIQLVIFILYSTVLLLAFLRPSIIVPHDTENVKEDVDDIIVECH